MDKETLKQFIFESYQNYYSLCRKLGKDEDSSLVTKIVMEELLRKLDVDSRTIDSYVFHLNVMD